MSAAAAWYGSPPPTPTGRQALPKVRGPPAPTSGLALVQQLAHAFDTGSLAQRVVADHGCLSQRQDPGAVQDSALDAGAQDLPAVRGPERCQLPGCQIRAVGPDVGAGTSQGVCVSRSDVDPGPDIPDVAFVKPGSTDMAVAGESSSGRKVRLNLQIVPGPWFGSLPVGAPDIGAPPKPEDDSAPDCRSQDPILQPGRVQLPCGDDGSRWPPRVHECPNLVAVHRPSVVDGWWPCQAEATVCGKGPARFRVLRFDGASAALPRLNGAAQHRSSGAGPVSFQGLQRAGITQRSRNAR
jgi:hypothetical protein